MPRSPLVLLALLGASVAGANSVHEEADLADPSATADDVPSNKQQQGRKLVFGLGPEESGVGNSHWHTPHRHTPNTHGHSPHLHEPHTHRESTAATSEPSPLLYFSLSRTDSSSPSSLFAQTRILHTCIILINLTATALTPTTRTTPTRTPPTATAPTAMAPTATPPHTTPRTATRRTHTTPTTPTTRTRRPGSI